MSYLDSDSAPPLHLAAEVHGWQKSSLLEAERLLTNTSVIDDLCPSNAIPEDGLPDQLEIIRSIRQTLVTDADRFDKHIQYLCKLTSTLRIRRAKAKHALSGVLLRSFPTEILCEIFFQYQALTTSKAKGTGSGIKKMFSHLPLMRICRSWRSIISSMPQFWSYIAFELDDIPNRKCLSPTASYSILSRWLQMSASSPLDVDIRMTKIDITKPGFPGNILIESSNALTILFQSARRFSSLYMDISVDMRLFSGSKDLYSSLAEFSFNPTGNLRPVLRDQSRVPVAYVGNAAKLTKLRVMDLRTQDMLDLGQGWQQIVDFESNSLPLILETLASSHTLKRLAVNCRDSTVDLVQDASSVSHNRLEHLELRHPRKHNTLLGYMSFPALTALDIVRACSGASFWNFRLPGFVSRCPHIQQVSIKDCDFTGCDYNSVRNFFLSLTSVVTLAIKESSLIGSSFSYVPPFRFLTPSLHDDVPLLPHLTQLCYMPTNRFNASVLTSTPIADLAIRDNQICLEGYQAFTTWLEMFALQSREPGLSSVNVDCRKMKGFNSSALDKVILMLQLRKVNARRL